MCATAKVVAVRGAVPRAESAATHLVTGAQSDAHWKLEVQLARRPEQQGGGEALRVERVTFREDLHHIASELPEETHRLLEQIATCEAPLMPPAVLWHSSSSITMVRLIDKAIVDVLPPVFCVLWHGS